MEERRKKGRPPLPASHWRACAEAGERFLALRRAAGLTQKQAAALVGVSRRTISTWEGGRGEVTQEALSLVSSAAAAGVLLANAKEVSHA